MRLIRTVKTGNVHIADQTWLDLFSCLYGDRYYVEIKYLTVGWEIF